MTGENQRNIAVLIVQNATELMLQTKSNHTEKKTGEHISQTNVEHVPKKRSNKR
jgi:hypothetical protein